MPPTPDPAALLDALDVLALRVDEAAASVDEAIVPSYPGGRRPRGIVTLTGGGARGRGEHVAWTLDEQTALRDALPRLVPRGRTRVGDFAAALAERGTTAYARAALEAAAIDLALRQAGTTLFHLAGTRPTPVRYVVSFGRCDDPVAGARRIMAGAPGVGLKLDVDPAWSDTVFTDLAALDTVAILDFKGGGTTADHERAQRALPAALLEDPGTGPWPERLRRRVSVDASILSAADVARLALRPAAVNLKPGRMGGTREVLHAAAACRTAGIPVYLGGMFEVDVGRRQLHVLAALLAPDGPNDIAPIGLGATRPLRPPRLALDAGPPGFG